MGARRQRAGTGCRRRDGCRVKRRTGPLARINLFRLAVFAIIVITAVLAFTLQAGAFRFLFRTALVVGAILLFGSYLAQWWLKRLRNSRDS